MAQFTFILLRTNTIINRTFINFLQDQGHTCLGYFEDPEEAIWTAQQLHPRFFIPDTDLPHQNGYALIRRVKILVETDGIVFTSSHDILTPEAFYTDVSGYIEPSDQNSKELLACMQTIQEGRRYISPSLSNPVEQNLIRLLPLVQQLNARERDFLTLLAQGLDNDEIARRLTVTPHTVSMSLNRLKQKLGYSTSRQLVVFAAHVRLWLGTM